MKLSEIMDEVLRSEDHTAIGMVALLSNERACRMAAAFDLMPAPYVEIRPGDPMAEIIEGDLLDDTDAATILEALWQSTQVDMNELCRRCGVLMVEHGRRLFHELRTNFVLYPDGTIHSRAREYLDALTSPKKKGDDGAE